MLGSKQVWVSECEVMSLVFIIIRDNSINISRGPQNIRRCLQRKVWLIIVGLLSSISLADHSRASVHHLLGEISRELFVMCLQEMASPIIIIIVMAGLLMAE